MNVIFEDYVKRCHSDNAGDLSLCNTVEFLDIPTTYPLWTSQGNAGGFIWKSLTTLFPPDIHLLDTKKRMHNEFFSKMVSQSGLDIMSFLTDSMENDINYRHLIEDGCTLIANSDILFGNEQEFERVRALGMKEYLRQNTTFNDSDCFTLDGDSLDILQNNVKDINIIFPLPVLMNSRLQIFAQLANALCKLGAKTVYGVFLTYCVPSHNGEDYHKYPNIPEIRGMSFSEMMNMY